MKRQWIEFGPKWTPGPLSYWVHRETDGKEWSIAQRFQPPLPQPVAGRGYPSYHVEFNGVEFRFASLDELQAAIDILGQKLLPTTIRLARDRGGDAGPNEHWLSRLPAKAKPWRYRGKAVKYLREALVQFVREIAGKKG